MAYHLYVCRDNRRFLFLFFFFLVWTSTYPDSPGDYFDQNKIIQIVLVNFSMRLATIQTTLWTVSWNLHRSILMSLNNGFQWNTTNFVFGHEKFKFTKQKILLLFFFFYFWWFVFLSFYSGSRIQPLDRLVNI